MQLMPSIRAKQKQSLIITPQLQQAIKLLQMTNLEIQAFLEEQALDNPFLEMAGDEAAPHTDALDPTVENNMAEAAQEDNLPSSLADMTPENNALADDPTAHSDLDNRYSSLDAPQKSHSDYDNEGEDRMGRIANPEPGLHAKIVKQINLAIAAKDRAIAYVLTDMLAPTGWLETPLDHISDTTGLPLERLEAVLMSLQTLEPVGVFARNLSECLKIQAKDAGDYDTTMAVVLDHLDLLGKGEIGPLARKADCSHDEILSALRLIRSYNPKPGEAYSNDLPPLGEPDVVVRKTADGWSVDLNRSTLPSIHIREDYADEISAKLTRDHKAEEDGFVANAVSSARWLKRALEQRNTTTLKICAAIISQQQDFLNYGMEALKPMSLKVIAEAVSMHESTISRVTNGTVINTPRGTFSLKAFFSVSIASDQGEGGMAATAVRTRIRNLIDGENPKKPMSDSDIASVISDQGITLARRTVAKYREMMRIPSSSERRRLARMQMIG
jgi:RNA polymerase sigma-54 factor